MPPHLKCFYCGTQLGDSYIRTAHAVCQECDGILDAFLDTNNLPEDVFENTPTVAVRAIINTIRSFNKSLLESAGLADEVAQTPIRIRVTCTRFSTKFASELRNTSVGPVACIEGRWYSVNGDQNEILDVRYELPYFGDMEIHRNPGLEHIDAGHREIYRYSAMWTHEFTVKHPEIKGCPSGTGANEELAAQDLRFRTNMESNTSF